MSWVSKGGLWDAFLHAIKSVLPSPDTLRGLVIILAVGSLYFGTLAKSFPILDEDSEVGNIAISILTFLVGRLAERLDFRGRFLHIPVWLIGLIVLDLQIFGQFGIWSGVAATVALVALAWLLVVQDWRRQEELEG